MDTWVPGDAQRRHLGRALRDARTTAELTQSRVATELDRSQGKIQKIEAGTAPITAPELAQWLELCRVAEEDRGRFRELAASDTGYSGKTAKLPRWPAFGQLIDLERNASEIRCLHGDRIPGTLQSEHYMLQVMTEVYGQVDVTDLIKLRRDRARILFQERRPRYRVILSESSVRRTLYGRPDIVIDQIEHLLTLMRKSELLELQILPLEARALFMDSDFRILRFADGKTRDFAYVESPGGADTFKVESDLKRFERHWESLHSVALSATQSNDYLSELVNSMTGNTEGSARD